VISTSTAGEVSERINGSIAGTVARVLEKVSGGELFLRLAASGEPVRAGFLTVRPDAAGVLNGAGRAGRVPLDGKR
jgi:hypothetical protein